MLTDYTVEDNAVPPSSSAAASVLCRVSGLKKINLFYILFFAEEGLFSIRFYNGFIRPF